MTSPFVIGRPLRANEAIFGRDHCFTLINDSLAHYASINIVGERRMGKSSLLCHLLENPNHRPSPGQPPLVLAKIDLQGGVSDAAHFYGHALRAFIQAEPQLALGNQAQMLAQQATASFDEFEASLQRWQDHYRPVLVLDEFERLLDPSFSGGFPFPAFFDGLRALITANQLAFVVASRLSLGEHFQLYPAAITSTFPNYLPPIQLTKLDVAAADALLLQGSAVGISLAEINTAKQWSDGHPCRLQCAGQAWYEARQQNQDAVWAKRRYLELSQQACLVSTPPVPLKIKLKRGLNALKQALNSMLAMPQRVLHFCLTLGGIIEKIGAFVIGLLVLAYMVAILTGYAKPEDLLDLLSKKTTP